MYTITCICTHKKYTRAETEVIAAAGSNETTRSKESKIQQGSCCFRTLAVWRNASKNKHSHQVFHQWWQWEACEQGQARPPGLPPVVAVWMYASKKKLSHQAFHQWRHAINDKHTDRALHQWWLTVAAAEATEGKERYYLYQ